MTKLDVINPLNDDLIDQIVDGALTPAQLRVAIDWLDRQPDGWKRCALALLEAQCWRESFLRVGEPIMTNLPGETPTFTPKFVHPIRKARRWVGRALAASVVAASFALGWLGHGARFGPRPDELAAAPSGEFETKARNAPQPESPTTTVGDTPRPTVVDVVDPRNDITMVARLRVGSANSQTALPILAGPGINTEWLKNQPPPVSEHSQAVLQQHGYQVDQRRRLISTILADGRRVTVPIDQVQIRYTGNNPL